MSVKLRTASSVCRSCDGATEVLLYVSIVFGVWAFGTTERWSTWFVNGLGYALGGVLVVKWLIRWLGGYSPPQWGRAGSIRKLKDDEDEERPSRKLRFTRLLTWCAAVLTVLVLVLCLVSAWNARATYLWGEQRLVYHDCIIWLPHSYDSASSWFAFWTYLGLALTFWSARDWLLGKDRKDDSASGSPDEAFAPGAGHARRSGTKSWLLPARLRRLLLVMCLNGGLVAAESIVQRVAGSQKLLFFRKNRVEELEQKLGPFAYRGNASEYFNLLWPAVAGFAMVSARMARNARMEGERKVSKAHAWLAVGATLMATAPFISGHRGGSIVSAALALFVVIVLIVANRNRGWRIKLGLFLLFCVGIQLGVFLGWDVLKPRLESALTETDSLVGRTRLWSNARRMVDDHPVWGTGPGTFYALYRFYLPSDQDRPEAYAHNDWLETRITFGGVGFAIVLLLLTTVPLNSVFGVGMPAPKVLLAMIWIGLVGCLAHARFDFPLQVHSIASLFMLLCCVSACAGRE
jgi:O-antigen ligase